ncbi:MAG: hypothetical protein RDV48_15045 [Candidatus Eremiobacteraeota bacterium]|nr:hypothetical protein [Candidatus Eremiobacteraeota bacterium]
MNKQGGGESGAIRESLAQGGRVKALELQPLFIDILDVMTQGDIKKSHEPGIELYSSFRSFVTQWFS